jgi:hypothetical protein
MTLRSALRPVELPDFFRDLGELDVNAVVGLLSSLSERFWLIEDERKENAFPVFHHTRHLILRFIGDVRDPRTWYERPLWQMLRPAVEPVMLGAVDGYEFRAPVFPKVMFARLAARASVDRHIDGGDSNMLTHKIHVPIVSHPDVTFEIAGVRRHLEVGHAYEVNNVKPHGVENPTDVDRIHLIFEVFDDAA